MKKILLIEDNNTIRENTAEILEMANYSVLTAANGKKWVEVALKNKPDLIICDIMMPELDGYGVLHLLHKNRETQHTPFIFLSARAERADVRHGMDVGADDYITKPFDPTELLNAIESRLRRADALQQEMDEAVSAVHAHPSSHEAMKQFLENRDTIRFKKKQLIYKESTHPSALYYLLKGQVKTFKTNDEGKELAIDLLCPNDYLGYLALLEGGTYKESAVAMTDTELAVIPRQDFEELISNYTDIARQFFKLIAKNVAEKEEHLLGLAYNSLRKKVADALIKLITKYAPARDGSFTIDTSRDNLATIAGTATESLIRTLGDFKAEGLISIKEGQITIINEKKLRKLAN
jgi:CRP/FNR family transcriptional regulator, cyclic AMP receptor protein